MSFGIGCSSRVPIQMPNEPLPERCIYAFKRTLGAFACVRVCGDDGGSGRFAGTYIPYMYVHAHGRGDGASCMFGRTHPRMWDAMEDKDSVFCRHGSFIPPSLSFHSNSLLSFCFRFALWAPASTGFLFSPTLSLLGCPWSQVW